MTTELKKHWSYKDFQDFGRWYSWHRRQETGRPASPNTLRTKQVHVAAAANTLAAPDEMFLGTSLGERSRVVFLMDKVASRMTPGAMRQHVYALSNYGDYAVAQGWIPKHEVRPADVPSRNPDKAIVCYSEEEMEQFVEASRGRGLRWWAFMCFLTDTGRRVGETLGLRWEWFRLDGDIPYIELPTTKNGQAQYVPMPRRLRTEVFTPGNISRLKGESREGQRNDWNRPVAEHPFPWSYGTARARFEYLCRVTGLPNRGFHNFRHTVITNRLARGMPLQAVSALAGHSSTAITDRRYNHTNALTFAHLIDEPE